MVLAQRIGKPRSAAVGFWLALATMNIYSYWWDYKAHEEIFEQFELAREGRRKGGGWYFLSNLFLFLRFVYMYHFVDNVRYIRTRLGFRNSLSPGAFLGFTIPAICTLLLLLPIGFVVISVSLGSRGEGDSAETYVKYPTLLVVGICLAGLSLVAYIVLEAIAYCRLQREINEVWNAYDQRRAYLMAPKPPARPAASFQATSRGQWAAAPPAPAPPKPVVPSPRPPARAPTAPGPVRPATAPKKAPPA